MWCTGTYTYFSCYCFNCIVFNMRREVFILNSMVEECISCDYNFSNLHIIFQCIHMFTKISHHVILFVTFIFAIFYVEKLFQLKLFKTVQLVFVLRFVFFFCFFVCFSSFTFCGVLFFERNNNVIFTSIDFIAFT